jgi:hypothetical protein
MVLLMILEVSWKHVEFIGCFTKLTIHILKKSLEGGEGGNNCITTLMKVQKVQRGQKTPHNGSAILPKNIQVAPFSLKGLINTILEIRLTNRSKGIDGFPGRHPNFNSSDPSLLENIMGGVLRIKMHPTPFRPKEIKNETPKNI